MGLENAFQIYDPEKGVAYSMENASKLVEDVLFQFFSKKHSL
ncbi:glycerate kinase [Cellulophaga tyrosinoxydans]|uniref:Glycerate kinase n=1 Tax=Cellulophaga tyrosinoxydans TaxID=504486 RepID=A0A1W1ZDE3_9FLAO|nr:glycerate kinase [Cellulophaga tyrosinoxydans]